MEDEGLEADPLLELSGTALRAYLVLLRSRKPLGVRELQRALGLRSPSTARHHIERLMSLGLVKQLGDGYVAVPPRRGLLRTYTLLWGRLVPRSLALSAFLVTATIVYGVLPGRDPVAVAILLIASGLSLYEALEAMNALKSLEEVTGSGKR